MKFSDKILKDAYRYCRAINRAHYENFPVASCIMPHRMRPAVDAIYAFSRIADDFADEEEFADSRLPRLEEWGHFLDDNYPTHPVFIALKDTRQKHDLPKILFEDLLQAFKQDVTKNRYQDFEDVMTYCRYSANPVGRLVLHLFNRAEERHLALSDAVCTALQLANFWQDVAVDLNKDRVYLPQDELARFDVSEVDLRRREANENFKKLLRFQIRRTQDIFNQGHELGLLIPGRLGAELRLTWLTGVRILELIEDNDHDVFHHRPSLGKEDFLKLFFTALNRRAYAKKVREVSI